MLKLGIDVGGASLKAAIVNTENGKFASNVFVVKAEKLSSSRFLEIIQQIVNHFEWKGEIGCGFPSVVQHGVVKTATNIGKDFIGKDLSKLIEEATNCKATIMNDADAAAMAEFKFGNAKDFEGTKLLLTLGTGIGAAIYKTELIPNLELGQLKIKNGIVGEQYCAASIKTRENLSYEVWAKRLNEYLIEINALINPDLIILGGGISKDYYKFEKYLDLKNKIKIATLLNDTGIVGAVL